MSKVISGYELCQSLVEAGLIPEKTRRIVIDIPVEDAVKVYYETFADDAMVELAVEELIKNKDRLEIKSVNDSDH